MSEPAWVPLGANPAPRVRKAPLVISSSQLGEMYWPDASTTISFMYLVLPTDYLSGDLTFKIMYRHGVAAGTSVLRWYANRYRENAAYLTIDSGVVVNQTPGDINSHVIARTIAAANVAPGDVYRVALSRLGADAGDTLAGNVLYDGGWAEYLADS